MADMEVPLSESTEKREDGTVPPTESSEKKVFDPFVPPSTAVDITTNKDGGVLKEIKREGEGDSTPLSGDTVSVHYVGTLTDGSTFDSSRERDELFEFKLWKGSVIKAWDLGVSTMKKGEVAVFYCSPEYAYGEKGSPPKIPPNATLIFEIELFSWKGEDLSEKKDGGIIRRKLESGEKYSTPNEGAMVTVHLIGRYNGKMFEERDVTFPIGEGSEFKIVSGLEKAIEKFKKGEKSIISLKPQYAFGTEGNKEFGIPPNADVEYEVFMENFEKAKESWELDNAERLEQAGLLKTKGTKYFKEGKYELALKQYKKILSFIEHMSGMKEDEEKEQKQLLLATHLNLAMGYLKEDKHVKALSACTKALEMDSNNVKGLFRKGLALFGLNEVELAKEDFLAVLQVEASNKAAANQVIQCNNKLKEQREKERKLYSNMFTKFAVQDTKREQRLLGDVMANPGTWGEDDSYFKDSKKNSELQNDTGYPEEMAAQEKFERFSEAVNSAEVEMIP